MDALDEQAVKDRRQNRECSAEDAEISNRLLGEMQLISLFVEQWS